MGKCLHVISKKVEYFLCEESTILYQVVFNFNPFMDKLSIRQTSFKFFKNSIQSLKVQIWSFVV